MNIVAKKWRSFFPYGDVSLYVYMLAFVPAISMALLLSGADVSLGPVAWAVVVGLAVPAVASVAFSMSRVQNRWIEADENGVVLHLSKNRTKVFPIEGARAAVLFTSPRDAIGFCSVFIAYDSRRLLRVLSGSGMDPREMRDLSVYIIRQIEANRAGPALGHGLIGSREGTGRGGSSVGDARPDMTIKSSVMFSLFPFGALSALLYGLSIVFVVDRVQGYSQGQADSLSVAARLLGPEALAASLLTLVYGLTCVRRRRIDIEADALVVHLCRGRTRRFPFEGVVRVGGQSSKLFNMPVLALSVSIVFFHAGRKEVLHGRGVGPVRMSMLLALARHRVEGSCPLPSTCQRLGTERRCAALGLRHDERSG